MNLRVVEPGSETHSGHKRNPGFPLDLDIVERVRMNRSALERRAATIGTRRTVKKDWQAAWLLKAITLIDLTTLNSDDTEGRVERLCAKARHPVRDDILEGLGVADLRFLPGAVCVYHTFVATAVKALEGSGIPVAADESVRSLSDAKTVFQKQAADYVNVKIMKTGVIQAMEIASFARSAGLRLMAGGMVETRIAMGCSFSLVLGLGGFDVLDLDTPLLLSEDPVEGGYRYRGPSLVPWDGPGLDLHSRPSGQAVTLK